MPKITEVFDRKLPTKIDPALLESQQKGGEGIGTNDETYAERMGQFNQSADVTE